MPETRIRKKWNRDYENKKKEQYDRMFIRIDKNLKNKFKEKIEKDNNYTDMSDFIIKNIENYLKK